MTALHLTPPAFAAIARGDRVRHRTRGFGTVERIERNAFGAVTRAWVRFQGDLIRVWADDVALMERAPPSPAWLADVVVIEAGAQSWSQNDA